MAASARLCSAYFCRARATACCRSRLSRSCSWANELSRASNSRPRALCCFNSSTDTLPRFPLAPETTLPLDEDVARVLRCEEPMLEVRPRWAVDMVDDADAALTVRAREGVIVTDWRFAAPDFGEGLTGENLLLCCCSDEPGPAWDSR